MFTQPIETASDYAERRRRHHSRHRPNIHSKSIEVKIVVDSYGKDVGPFLCHFFPYCLVPIYCT